MLKSCKYCGRIHDSKMDCGCKPKRIKESTAESSFRGTAKWKKKRMQILERDGHMCQLCLRGLHDIGTRRFNGKDLEVHHIVPLSVNFDLRLEDDNLITLCGEHHELAEAKAIEGELLRDIAKENRGTPLPFSLAFRDIRSTTGIPM